MKRWIQITISVLLLGLLLYIIDINQTIETFKHASYGYVILILLTITLNRFTMAFKWNILLRANKIFVSNIEILKIYYMSNFLGLFLPATIGGDIVRLYMVNSKVKKASGILASIIVERLIGFLILFIFAFIALLFFLESLRVNNQSLDRLEYLLGILILLGLIFIVISFNRKTGKFLKNLFHLNESGFIGRYAKKIEKFHDAYLVYKKSKKEVSLFSLLTFAEIITVIIWCYFGILAFNQNVDILYLFIIIPIIQALNRIPISFDGFGLNEAGYVYFLSFVGIESHISFSIGLLIHLSTTIGILPGLIFYALNKSKVEEIKKYKIEEAVE
jgi:hypothetical protein